MGLGCTCNPASWLNSGCANGMKNRRRAQGLALSLGRPSIFYEVRRGRSPKSASGIVAEWPRPHSSRAWFTRARPDAKKYLFKRIPRASAFTIQDDMPGINEGFEMRLKRIATYLCQRRHIADRHTPMGFEMIKDLQRKFRH